ncbi:SDR family NAD(P)-dependent oxidoreductase [Aromatoleum diolicum]|uniref:SDR family NAD(P)-dependent oxidoreductase n=1 Tax=Aromatoleum diolicum TaxID=75796 RepID=A0ABX1QEN1_9RHOO|nr:SDR family NAD(P)-dependent oxidoreductase [Aromatoleum diolicum]NMG75965.1 SDR family NAD(P)-dependent oxidoreductase [Aromatoleum diolicum]
MAFGRPLNTPVRDWQCRRVWLVGASTGIGAALARRLAEQGARLALSARGREKLDALAAQCPGAHVVPMDVTQPQDYPRVRDEILALWGGVDVVVLNAGTYAPMRAWELTPDLLRHTLDTNLLGVMDGVAAVVPQLLEQGSGALVIVGSVAGYGGLPRAAAYGPSKAALINLAESLYLDLAPRGISVFLVSPGFVATPLTAQNDFRMPALIQPDEAADAIVAGLARGAFEIHFPRRFTCLMKFLRLLPYHLYFPAIRRATGL